MAAPARETENALALARFLAPANAAYLRGLRGGAGEAPASFAERAGAAVLAGASGDAWKRVRRLNRALLAADAPGAEAYHLEAFEAESLAPAGYEGLNAGPAPRYALSAEGAPGPGEDGEEAWGPGEAGRSAEEAWAEYWGEGWGPTGRAPAAGRAFGGGPGGEAPAGAGGGRFARRAVPFWQKGGREGVDRGIGETLPAAREHAGQVRGWPAPRGEKRPPASGPR